LGNSGNFRNCREASGQRQVSEQFLLLEKDLVIASKGLRGLKIRALSGAGMEDLVALETWRSESEIVNLT
jgi:hypothetical protein